MLNDTAIAASQGTQLNSGTYFCRGCGGPLQEGSKARFHAECRRNDKRRRVAERRQRQATRESRVLRKHLGRMNCPDCGASLAKLIQTGLDHSPELACDTAQRPSERMNSGERLDGQDAELEPAGRL